MIWPFNTPKPADYQPGNGMDADSRKKAFWLIKKLTSLEAWTRKYAAYKYFSAEFEKLAIEYSDDLFYTKNHKNILDELIQFEKALEKLRHGDRSCFKWGVDGSFAHTFAMAPYIARIVTDEKEFIVEEDTEALKESLRGIHWAMAWGAESNREGEPSQPFILSFMTPKAAYYEGPYPQCHPLPEVPLAVPLVQIKTGEEIPVTGIWEPNTPGAAMDYQLAGTEAPEVKVSHARGLEPTVWTLLWADHRYEDGSIPEEEALFFAIPETPPPAPADSGPTRCEGGRPCPSPFFPTAVQEPL